MDKTWYKFKEEAGAIITPNNTVLHKFDGSGVAVEFPNESIVQLHKLSPGIVYKLVHTHPPGVPLSDRDRQTLQTLAFTFHPFPIRMSVIVPMKHKGIFLEKTYFAQIEMKEFWEERGKGERKFTIDVEEEVAFDIYENNGWIAEVIGRSYEYQLP